MITALVLLLAVPQEADAVKRGVKFLLETQDKDGSWYPGTGEGQEPGMRIAVTALCMHALIEASEESVPAALRGLRFIEKNLDALDGPFESNRQFTFNPWGLALGLQHLEGALRRWPGQKPDMKPILDALVRKAAKTQLACGGWTYLKMDNDGKEWKDGSVSFLSASMILGLVANKVDVARAVADLEKSFDEKQLVYCHYGKYGTAAGADGAARTVQARLALLEAGRGTAEALEEALREFLKQRPEYEKVRNTYAHTPPTNIAGYYYYFGHAHAAAALRKLGRDPGGIVAVLRGALLKEQEADGSWIDVAAGGKSCGTAYALRSLADLRGLRWRESVANAVAEAKADAKRVVVFFTDGKADAAETEKSLGDAGVHKLLDRAVCVRVAIRKDDPTCKKAGVSAGSAILILDASVDDPFAKPVRKWTGKRSAKTLAGDLEKALEAK